MRSEGVRLKVDIVIISTLHYDFRRMEAVYAEARFFFRVREIERDLFMFVVLFSFALFLLQKWNHCQNSSNYLFILPILN